MPNYIELEPVGKVLYEEYIKPNNLTVEEVAQAISVPVWQLMAIIENGTPMTAEIDLLLTKYFGISPEGFFMRWQQHYDERKAKRSLSKKLAKITPFSKLGKVAVL